MWSRRHVLSALMSAVVTGCARSTSAVMPPGDVRLFLLAGQSNLSGRAPIVHEPPAPGIYVFGNDYRWHNAREPVDSPNGQVDAVSIDPLAAMGPAVPFARRLRATLREDVGLIPCSKGGSTLRQWARATSRDTLYGSMRARAQATGLPMTGLLFFQGESDARHREDAERWASRFSAWVADVRLDFGDLPIVFAQIGPHYPKVPYWSLVQTQQAAVRLPRARMIYTSDLAVQDDGLHFTAESASIIGTRFADAMAGLLSEPFAPRQ